MDTVRFNGLRLGPNGIPDDNTHHGGYIDFHFDSNISDDAIRTSRIIEDNMGGVIGLNFQTDALKWNHKLLADIFQSKKLLWENTDPGNTFVAQTVPIDLSEYQQVQVICILNGVINETGLMYSFVFDIGTLCWCELLGGHEFIEFREARASTSGVQFGGGYLCYTYTQLTSRDDRMIPWKIYGIRGVQ